MSDLPILGIIAGTGRLPVQLVEACHTINRPCFVLSFAEETNVDAIEATPHAVVRLGAVGEALKKLREANVKDIVLAGKVSRPSLTALKPDLAATKLLAKLGKAFFSGDDALLTALVHFLEGEGFNVVSAQDVLRALIATAGVYGRITPSARDQADIAHGLQVAKQLGALDIGQAVIVENGYVLGVEAAEGTNALISRCASLKREARSGVLVKAKKPRQDERVDLPTIGLTTIDTVHEAGFSGIAIEAGGCIILDREHVIARANELGIFLVGINA